MTTSAPQELAEHYHADLPGIARAALQDAGVSDEVINRYRIGWDGESFTVPIAGPLGRIVLFERWTPDRIGYPAARRDRVELFGWPALADQPREVILAEGILETLILESRGFAAIAATDTGLFFKTREWAPALKLVPTLVLALRRGEKRSRTKFAPSRSEIREAILEALPETCQLEWPEEIGDQGGAHEYFVTLGHSVTDFRALLERCR